jgi:RNA polymerase sigma factor (sigma-70 family)
MDKDFNLKITIRNGRLLKAIRERYESVADLARKMGQHPSSVNSLVTMKLKPINEKGWTEMALNVAAMVNKEPEDLWPKYMREIKLKRASAEVSMDLESVKQIMADSSSEKNLSQISLIKQLFANLSTREERILRLRWVEDHSLGEAAKIFGVSKERVRFIESKAFRKMKHTAKTLGYSKPIGWNALGLTQLGKDLFND